MSNALCTSHHDEGYYGKKQGEMTFKRHHPSQRRPRHAVRAQSRQGVTMHLHLFFSRGRFEIEALGVDYTGRKINRMEVWVAIGCLDDGKTESVQINLIKWEREMGHSGAAFLMACP